jgi:tRNA1Val (adenine37-N6)-methyltransferase
LAAHFQPPARSASLLDLGSGCGIIGLIVMYRWREKIRNIAALEIQPALAGLTQQNFIENGYQSKCRAVQGDLKNILQIFEPESFSQVICNPPFYKEGSGRKNIAPEALLARHQILANLSEIVRAAASVLKSGGCLVLIYPAERLSELMSCLTESRLEPKRLQIVYSYPDDTASAKMVLVSAVKNGGREIRILPPLYIYSEKNGSYSPQMQQLYATGEVEQSDPATGIEEQ